MKKHDANTKKGRLINVQIALIAVLCLAYVMHEVYTYSPPAKKTFTANKALEAHDDVFQIMGGVTAIPNQEVAVVNIPKPKLEVKLVTPAEPVKVTETVKPEVVKNNVEIPENATDTDNNIESPSNSSKVENNKSESTSTASSKTKAVNTSKTFNKKSVDMLPVYPGCEKLNTNEQRAKCFEEKVQRLINRKFNPDTDNVGNGSKLQRISLYFEVDQYGLISNIKAYGAEPELINEAKRVAQKLPKMTPAKSGNTNVKMAYNVPIIYQTRN